MHAVLYSILVYVAWLGSHCVVLRHVKLNFLTIQRAKRESGSPGQLVIVIHITKVGSRVGCDCEIYMWIISLLALLLGTEGFDIPGAWPA